MRALVISTLRAVVFAAAFLTSLSFAVKMSGDVGPRGVLRSVLASLPLLLACVAYGRVLWRRGQLRVPSAGVLGATLLLAAGAQGLFGLANFGLSLVLGRWTQSVPPVLVESRWVVAYLVALGAVAEELLVRGWMFGAEFRPFPRARWIVPTVIFTAWHLSWPDVLLIPPAALLFSLIYHRSGTLAPLLLGHVVFNLTARFSPMVTDGLEVTLEVPESEAGLLILAFKAALAFLGLSLGGALLRWALRQGPRRAAGEPTECPKDLAPLQPT